MRILITGSQGFVGKNLALRLSELPDHQILRHDRDDDADSLAAKIVEADAIVHLAGENRPADQAAFWRVNRDFTATLCNAMQVSGHQIPVVFASSTHAERDTDYGRSKLAAEQALSALAESQVLPLVIFRFPGIFGKWARPNYNSVVATFCHNVANDLPLRIDSPDHMVDLVYIDDVVDTILDRLKSPPAPGTHFGEVTPSYRATVGHLAEQIEAFKNCRDNLITEAVGTGLTRALYSTYVSHLPRDKFSYPLTKHGDARGVFTEFLKTHDSGQFSYFTAHPGVTRGGHYHHSKTEKFLVVKGRALFKFRHVLTDETHELTTDGEQPQVVETLPGWSHDITNVGDAEMIVMLWANENFDRQRPDTLSHKV